MQCRNSRSLFNPIVDAVPMVDSITILCSGTAPHRSLVHSRSPLRGGFACTPAAKIAMSRWFLDRNYVFNRSALVISKGPYMIVVTPTSPPDPRFPGAENISARTRQSRRESLPKSVQSVVGVIGGPDRDRTDDLFHAMEARSQLRHRPTHDGDNSLILAATSQFVKPVASCFQRSRLSVPAATGMAPCFAPPQHCRFDRAVERRKNPITRVMPSPLRG